MSFLLSIKLWVGALSGACLALLWALLWYGPQQYRLGGDRKAAELQEIYDRVGKELFDAADKAEFDRRVCVRDGGVYVVATGQCHKG